MRIVLGLDASPHSEAALEFVRKTAWPPKTVVIVVSSVPLPLAALATTAPVTGLEIGVWDKELKQLHEQVAGSAARTLKEAGLAAETRVAHGDPRDRLIEAATNERADLLVVGSHGRSGLPKLLLGSVASHVVTHAPCSVLVIKLPAYVS